MYRPLSLLLMLLFLSPALSCRCRLPTIQKTFYGSDVVNFIKAKVIYIQPSPPFDIRYTLLLKKNFKGCLTQNVIQVITADNSAACGARLGIFKEYVLPVRVGTLPRISSCDFIREYNRLSLDEKTFLDTRNVCCDGSCSCASGKPPVNCFRQPCSPPETAPCVEATECRDNYCGGCFAEWFNDDGCPACASGKLSLSSV